MQAIGTGPVFFLLVTEKLYFSPMDHAVFGSPSQTVVVLRCIKMMIFTLGLNVPYILLLVNSMILLWIILIIALSTISFFSSILLPIALLSLAIVGFIQVNTLITALLCFLESQQSDGLQCSQGCDLYLLFKEIQINNACNCQKTIKKFSISIFS